MAGRMMVLATLAAAAAVLAPTAEAAVPEVDPTTVLVAFERGTDAGEARAIAARNDVRAGEKVDGTGFRVVSTGGAPAAVVEQRLEQDDAVVSAEPNHIRRAMALPNDPMLAKGRQPWIDAVRLPEAWDRAKGTTAQTIAVVDTGVDAGHPDLGANVLPGIDLVDDQRPATADEPGPRGHGTMVAGVAAARTDDDFGLAGAAWSASILPVTVFDERGEATDADVAEGIVQAADRGVDVINLSLGGPAASTVLRQAVEHAQARDVLVVAAAGNDGTDEEQFPAAYPGVVAVGATDPSGNVAAFSSFGEWVDLVAPGWSVRTPQSGGLEWSLFTGGVGGTSIAAPIVSGAAIVLGAQHPDWSAAQIAERLRSSAADAGPRGIDEHYGHGILDVGAATGAPAAAPRRVAADTDGAPDAARRIGMGRGPASSFEQPGDEDWYVVHLDAPGRYRFQVEPVGAVREAAEQLQPGLTLLTAGGQPLLEASSAPFASRVITFDAPRAGDVLLRAVNEVPSRSQPDYAVRVEAVERPGPPERFLPPVEAGGSGQHGVALADATGDGRTDVLTLGRSSGGAFGLQRAPQDAEGELEEPELVAELPQGSSSLAAGDVDADGRPDVAVATGSQVVLLRGTADGLAPPDPVPGTADAREVHVARLDGDQRADLVVRSATDAGTGSLTALRSTTGGWSRTVVSSARHLSVAVGDLSGDGLADLAAPEASPGTRTAVFRQRPDGTWSDLSRIPSAQTVAIGDATGDGFGDLIAGASQPFRVLVYAQDAGHSLAPALTYTVPLVVTDLGVADVDADGRGDVVAGGPAGAQLLPGRAETGLGAPEPLGLVTTGEGDLALGDVTGDEAVDVVGSGDVLQVLAQPSATWPRPVWVLGTTPAEHAEGVPAGATPTVRFGRALDAASVGATTVRVERAGSRDPIPGSVAYDPAARRATVTPVAPLAPGSYDLRVTGVRDAGGARMDERERVRFTVGTPAADTTPPDTRFSAGGDDRGGSVRWAFFATEPGERFECSLDTGAWAACRSPLVFDRTLSHASHTLRVRAVDAAGNTDPTPASSTVHNVPDDAREDTPTDLTGPSGSVAFDNRDTRRLAFRWTAPSSGTLTVDTEGSAFDTVMSVEAGTDPMAFERLGEDDDGGAGSTSRVAIPVTAGAAYTVLVSGFDDGAGRAWGAGRLQWALTSATDTTPPDTRIVQVPDNEAAGFAYRSERAARFECRLDAGAWFACAADGWWDPEGRGLADGTHAFAVRAVDRAGNADPTPATHSFPYVRGAPETTGDGGSFDPTRSNDLALRFAAQMDGTSPASGVSFTCRFDGGAWSPCASPFVRSDVADGRHVLEARATRTATGATDPSPLRAVVVVDTTAPDTAIGAGPPAQTTDRDAEVTFASEPGAVHECRLDGERWRACRSPEVHGGLADGEHVLEVRGIDAVGNVEATPAERRWTVGADATPPETSITGGPGATSSSTTPAWTFTSPEAAATFACRMDAGTWLPCTSPYTAATLAPGEHRFAVRAVDAAGNADPTPAQATTTVAAPPGRDATGDGAREGSTGGGAEAPRTDADASPQPAVTERPATPADRRAPRLTGLRLRQVRSKLQLVIQADEPVELTLRFERLRARAGRRGRRATRVPGTVAVRLTAGRHRVVLARRLAPGRYRAVLVAADAAGNRRTALVGPVRIRGR